MHQARLTAFDFWVDVRIGRVGEARVASADTPDGPTLAADADPATALRNALEPFNGVIDELLASAPADWNGLGS